MCQGILLCICKISPKMDVQHPVETAYVRPENTAGAKTCNRKRDKQAARRQAKAPEPIVIPNVLTCLRLLGRRRRKKISSARAWSHICCPMQHASSRAPASSEPDKAFRGHKGGYVLGISAVHDGAAAAVARQRLNKKAEVPFSAAFPPSLLCRPSPARPGW